MRILYRNLQAKSLGSSFLLFDLCMFIGRYRHTDEQLERQTDEKSVEQTDK